LTFDVDDGGGEGSFACSVVVTLRSVPLRYTFIDGGNPIAMAMQMQQPKDRSIEFRIKVFFKLPKTLDKMRSGFILVTCRDGLDCSTNLLK